MTQTTSPDYSHLLERLADPAAFDPDSIPTGRDYLHSDAKLAFDMLWGLAVLPITGIPTALGASAIMLIDHEAPMFRQQRVGYLGLPFTINKLRTMPGAPKGTDSNERHDDPRRSRLGKVLSLLRIDESPQLINVAKREMSIIGPRPLIGPILDNARRLVGPKEADEWNKVRVLAKPGIFDEFSNLHHSYQAEGEDVDHLRLRIATESAYILEKASFTEDTRIMAMTVGLFGATILHHARHAVDVMSTHLGEMS
jgi:lipopolysaccharide/colanic/teichoic acid biosynthesis glycosyltransferase